MYQLSKMDFETFNGNYCKPRNNFIIFYLQRHLIFGTVTKLGHYLTMLDFLAGESFIAWDLGLSGLVQEKAHSCLSSFIKSPFEGIDTRQGRRSEKNSGGS